MLEGETVAQSLTTASKVTTAQPQNSNPGYHSNAWLWVVVVLLLADAQGLHGLIKLCDCLSQLVLTRRQAGHGQRKVSLHVAQQQQTHICRQ